MQKKLYIPVAARRAAEEAARNLFAMDNNQNTYVPFESGKSEYRRRKSFDAYFQANI